MYMTFNENPKEACNEYFNLLLSGQLGFEARLLLGTYINGELFPIDYNDSFKQKIYENLLNSNISKIKTKLFVQFANNNANDLLLFANIITKNFYEGNIKITSTEDLEIFSNEIS